MHGRTGKGECSLHLVKKKPGFNRGLSLQLAGPARHFQSGHDQLPSKHIILPIPTVANGQDDVHGEKWYQQKEWRETAKIRGKGDG
jgi:hypothetical protein